MDSKQCVSIANIMKSKGTKARKSTVRIISEFRDLDGDESVITGSEKTSLTERYSLGGGANGSHGNCKKPLDFLHFEWFQYKEFFGE
jgi:hypothetical protein